MREILFRGKRINNGEWVEGCLVHRSMFYGEPCDNYFILCDGEFHCDYYNASEVIPETIGQYTGLTDKNGKKIFEGDICTDEFRTLLVRYDFFQWNCKVIETTGLIKGLEFPLWHWDRYPQNGCRQLEVIGNIHDNPELLKESEQ